MFLKPTKAALIEFDFLLLSSMEWYLNGIIQEADLTSLSNGQPSSVTHPAWQGTAACHQLCSAGVSILLVGQMLLSRGQIAHLSKVIKNMSSSVRERVKLFGLVRLFLTRPRLQLPNIIPKQTVILMSCRIYLRTVLNSRHEYTVFDKDASFIPVTVLSGNVLSASLLQLLQC